MIKKTMEIWGTRVPRRSSVKSKWMQPNAPRPKTQGDVTNAKMLKFNWNYQHKWALGRFFLIWHYVFNGFRNVPNLKTFKFVCKFTSNVRNWRGAAATEPSDAQTVEFVSPNRHRNNDFYLTWMGSLRLWKFSRPGGQLLHRLCNKCPSEGGKSGQHLRKANGVSINNHATTRRATFTSPF